MIQDEEVSWKPPLQNQTVILNFDPSWAAMLVTWGKMTRQVYQWTIPSCYTFPSPTKFKFEQGVENDDTPQPLDQWTNSPFMGQQVGNWSLCHALWPQKEAHCASNIVSNSHLFHSNPIDLPIPKIWLLKIWPWKYKVKVMGEVKVLSHNLGPTSYQIMLEIPTGPPVRGRQLWRRTGNFLLILLQFNVYDLRLKPWGPTTFWLSFQHRILWIHILVCQSTLLFLW